MKVVFECSLLSCQGTSVAVGDYANFNQTILGNESIILTKTPELLYKQSAIKHDPIAVDFFSEKYNVLHYNDWNHAENILESLSPDLLYTLKGGGKDEIVSKNIKTAVHAIFRYTKNDIHGDRYAYISEWLSKTFSNREIPYVPHIVNLPNINDDIRSSLNIPKDAIVIGRHGSKTTFNIPFVFDVVNRIIEEREDVYFLFLNTDSHCENFPEYKLINHNRIIHLPVTFNVIEKTKFINTCDVMLHARVNGESFGLSVAEFSVKNKPVITWTGKNSSHYFPHGHDLAHIDMLGDNGIYYNDYEELYYILKHFNIDKNREWDCYSKDYNPNSVMKKFKNVFLD